MGLSRFYDIQYFDVGNGARTIYRTSYRGEKAGNAVEEFLDDHFPDERMERIYPNAKVVE